MINLIKNMHSYCRPAGSYTEQKFIERYIETIPGITKDGFGNYFLRIGNDPIIWTAHTDTMHSEPGYQAVELIGDHLMLKNQNNKGSCLGADDASGCFLLKKLIEIKKEGLFCFFRAEEVGGLGSDYFVRNYSELLKQFKYVISLDRKGTDSIITHQGQRCCSDKFAESLREQLGKSWYLDSSGLFTDSLNFIGDVGEATNLSSGYSLAHSRFETLDIRHLIDLLGLLIKLDVSKLVSERLPGEKDYQDYHRYYGSDKYNPYDTTSKLFPLDDTTCYVANSFTDLVSTYPEIAEKELRAYGVSEEDFKIAIYNSTGELTSDTMEGY